MLLKLQKSTYIWRRQSIPEVLVKLSKQGHKVNTLVNIRFYFITRKSKYHKMSQIISLYSRNVNGGSEPHGKKLNHKLKTIILKCLFLRF